MAPRTTGFDDLVALLSGAGPNRRLMVGLAGPPGSGKSTIAQRLAVHLGPSAVVVPMDGFHLAQRVLTDLGLADVKGAPETFDAAGFVTLLERLRHGGDGDVHAPSFDRSIEEPVAGAIPVRADHRIVIIEGNYLLLDGAWEPIAGLLDVTVYVDLDDGVRRERLIERHVAHGRSRAEAEEWVDRSDERNAALIATTRHRATYAIRAG